MTTEFVTQKAQFITELSIKLTVLMQNEWVVFSTTISLHAILHFGGAFLAGSKLCIKLTWQEPGA